MSLRHRFHAKSDEPSGIQIAPYPLTVGAAKLGNPRGPLHPPTLEACRLRSQSNMTAGGARLYVSTYQNTRTTPTPTSSPYFVSTLAAAMLRPSRLNSPT